MFYILIINAVLTTLSYHCSMHHLKLLHLSCHVPLTVHAPNIKKGQMAKMETLAPIFTYCAISQNGNFQFDLI